MIRLLTENKLIWVTCHNDSIYLPLKQNNVLTKMDDMDNMRMESNMKKPR